jgi:hypothetical protein
MTGPRIDHLGRQIRNGLQRSAVIPLRPLLELAESSTLKKQVMPPVHRSRSGIRHRGFLSPRAPAIELFVQQSSAVRGSFKVAAESLASDANTSRDVALMRTPEEEGFSRDPAP